MASNPSVLSREAGTSAPTAKSGRRRPSTSHILIALTVVLAFVFNYLALNGNDATVDVAVAGRPILEGTPLERDMVRMVPIPADFEAVSALVEESDLAGMLGRVASRTIGEGDLIDESSLIATGVDDGLRTMSIPVPIEHAAGARLVVGDRVDVITVRDGVAGYVASDLSVVALADQEQGGLGSQAYHVTVAVDEDQALAIAEAIAFGALELVRSTGAGSVGGAGS